MSRWRVAWARLRALFGREAVIRDIDEELRLHIDMATEANLARGMTPAEARRAAVEGFGNLGIIRDSAYDVRGGGMLETLWQDLRFGGRVLRKNPGLTLSAVLTLALGIGATTAIFSVVNPLLIRGIPFREPERLVEIVETNLPKFTSFAVASGNFASWREQRDGFERLAAYQPTALSLTGGGDPERLRTWQVTSDYFELFGVRPQLGRTFLPEEDTPGNERVVVLSGGLWQRRFGGDPSILNRTLILDDQSYTVVGVMPIELHPVMGEVDLWVPAALTAEDRQQHGGHSMHAVGRLKAGVSLEQAEADLNAVERRLEEQFPDSNAGWRAKIEPMSEVVLRNVRPALLLLSAAVAFVLLIACANVASLLLGRTASREREIAVRVALGAGRWRIIRQLASESLLLSVVGGALGLLLGNWGVDVILALAPQALGGLREIHLDLPLVGFALLVSLMTGLAVGIVPALQASRTDLNAALKEGGRGATSGKGPAGVRRTLVVVEVAACLLLMVGAGLLIRSFTRLLAVDPGFNAETALTVEIDLPKQRYADDASRAAFTRRALGELAALPGVNGVAAAQTLPFKLDWLFGFNISGRTPEEPGKEPSANYYAITPDYFRVMGIRLVRGRAFSDRDAADAPPVVIINEKLAQQYFPGEDPVGKSLQFDRRHPNEIVGVVADVRQYGLADPVTYQMYEPFAQRPMSTMTLLVRGAGDPTQLGAAVRSRIAGVDEQLPVPAMKTMGQIVSESVVRRRFSLVVLSVFAGIALLLSIVGIYGVISDAVRQRTQEIGVRIALGARSGHVMRLMMSQGLLPAFLGIVVGLAASLAGTRLMSSLLFGVTATDAPTLVLASLFVAAVAAVACYLPARRASKVDPMVALRFGG